MSSAFNGPGYPIMNVFYENTIRPNLKKDPSRDMFEYFHQKAWEGWTLKIGDSDIKRMLFVKWMCGEIEKEDPEAMAGFMRLILEESHETHIMNALMGQNLRKASESKNDESFFIEALRKYKNLFERQFRIWSSIPFYFAKMTYKQGSIPNDLDGFYNVGAPVKHDTLEKEYKILHGPLPLNVLTLGCKRDVRNAGEGHDRYEVTDTGDLLLKPVKPYTGETKQTSTYTKKEFCDLIKELEKSIWCIQMGVMTFMSDHPEISKKVNFKKKLKRSEIQARMKAFAKDHWMTLKSLEISKDRKHVKLELQHTPRIVGQSGQIFMGNGEAYDIVNKKVEVKFRDQILGAMQHIIMYLAGESLPEIEVKLLDKAGKSIADPIYSPEELKKFELEKNEANVPKPSSGSMTDESYEIVAQAKVPYGMREVFEKLID